MMMKNSKLLWGSWALIAAGMILAVVLSVVSMCGCLSTQQREVLKDRVHAQILEYLETKGEQQAYEYIDKLVDEGKLGKEWATKIKNDIPHGIDKVRETMGEDK